MLAIGIALVLLMLVALVWTSIKVHAEKQKEEASRKRVLEVMDGLRAMIGEQLRLTQSPFKKELQVSDVLPVIGCKAYKITLKRVDHAGNTIVSVSGSYDVKYCDEKYRLYIIGNTTEYEKDQASLLNQRLRKFLNSKYWSSYEELVS